MKKKGTATSRFPVARIKKIMQADDDVGKVAQSTPLLVSKAVELFLESLVQAASTEASSRGSKRVQAYHLKHAVQADDTFDFLRPSLASVPDPVASGAADDDEDGSRKAKGKGKGKGKGRKKKADTEEEAVAAAPPPPAATAGDEDDEEEEDYY